MHSKLAVARPACRIEELDPVTQSRSRAENSIRQGVRDRDNTLEEKARLIGGPPATVMRKPSLEVSAMPPPVSVAPVPLEFLQPSPGPPHAAPGQAAPVLSPKQEADPGSDTTANNLESKRALSNEIASCGWGGKLRSPPA